jgi:CubicO group peptidase (beta-lactamase class C family)
MLNYKGFIVQLTVRVFLLTYIFIVGLAVELFPQNLPDSTITKINNSFKEWNNKTPGCVLGIIRNDSLIFAKGYGMANLEYDIPNTPATIYHMASVSKQFTAYCIVLLARQGKLKLDDNIRDYLPWFPDLGDEITIRNLLNHTSGIRDQWQLLAISGTRLDDVITQDQIIKILSRQQALNFKPGYEYRYCNSGYTMLAEIVKAVTGKSLRQFADSAIFKPLGMNDTHFHDDYTEIVRNRSYSYNRIDKDQFANCVLSYSNTGATSLFTTINDMSKWIMNFYHHRVGDQQDIDQLTEKGRLISGKEIKYSLGIFADQYKGYRQFSHGGSDAGYRTFMTVFPDIKMGFVLFSNLGDFDVSAKAYEIVDLFIRDTTQKAELPAKVHFDSTQAIITNIPAMQEFLGDYISDDGLHVGFDIKQSKLFYHIYGNSGILVRQTFNMFSEFNNPEIKFVFSSNSVGNDLIIITPEITYYLKKFIKNKIPDADLLKTFVGTYNCPELDCNYSIVLRNKQLFLTNNKYNDIPLILINEDHLTNNTWFMGHLLFTRNTRGKVTGFEVNSGRIMHLRFNKIRRPALHFESMQISLDSLNVYKVSKSCMNYLAA